MSSHRRQAPRTDANQPDIVKELRKQGYSVSVNHDDILIGKDGINIWIEIKDDKTLRQSGLVKAGAIKDSQIELLRDWLGQYDIAWDVEEIHDIILQRKLELELRMLRDIVRERQLRYSSLTGKEYFG